MTTRSRIGGALAIAPLLVLGAACGSSAGTASGDGAVDAKALTATVPPSSRASTATTATSEDHSSATTATTAAPGACSLLTGAQATAAFGETAVAGDQSTDQCWWSSATGLKTVNLIRRTDDVAAWRSGYQNSYWNPNDLGDEGYTGSVFDSVVWRIGDVEYEVNVVYSTAGDPAAVALELAQQAEARL